MNVLIIGGGQVGRNLALFLAEEKRHSVTLIEKRERVAADLARALIDVTVVEGDGCDPAVLREVGAERADAIAAVTGDDEDNLVIALLCKREFRIQRVAARVNNPKNAWLFTRRMGVDIAVDEAQMIARSLETDINVGAVVQLLRLREGQISLIEITVAPQSRSAGQPVHRLQLPPESVLVAVVRADGGIVIPSGETLIQAGDQVIAMTRQDHESALAECFQ
jgi:trk system potassium uptake protein TrkA